MPDRFDIVRLAALVLLLLCTKTGYSRPDMSPLGPNIADRGSAYYRFTVNTFDSSDGQRHYKVWTGIPNITPPKEGFPVLYMLDGNAVMDKLSDAFLQKLSAAHPPVLVVIGYQTALPFDLDARAYDYTPATKDNPQAFRGRAGGGSDIFRHLLEKTIAPVAEKGIKIDENKRGLWGHSYGGLFVMDAWLKSTFFNAYYAAVPSLAQNNFALLNEVQSTPQNRASAKHLYILEGDGDRGKKDENKGPDVLHIVRNTVSQLNEKGVSATYRLYPGLTHGAMFTASLYAALLQQADAAR
ncbi:alpha/beta hydrolase-fold protein [Kosakonia sp. H02]|nr:alpha/beta hydrolase-fold protein [Kosakonia sp. H02]